MTKRRPKNRHNQDLLEALKKLPNPIEDKWNGLLVFVEDGPARSNQTRYEHIVQSHHRLKVRDIESIPEGIKGKAIFLKDAKKRKRTYNYFFRRKGSNDEFIKVSVQKDPKNPKVVRIKTIYITKAVK